MPNGKGMIDEDKDNFIGTFWGQVSSPFCCETVESADMYVFVGAIHNDYTSCGYTTLLKEEKMIAIHENEVVICGERRYHGVLMREVLAMLASKCERQDASLVNYRRMFVPRGQPPALGNGGPLTMNVLMHHVQELLTPDMCVVAETGDSWFNGQKLKLPKGCLYVVCPLPLSLFPRQKLIAFFLFVSFIARSCVCFPLCRYEFQMQYGSIGWSVGATLGAAAALKDKRVLALIGDGSFQMTAQDVSTMVKYHLNPIILLLNNDGYVIEVEIHDGPYNEIHPWDYCGLVRSLAGKRGENCHTYLVKTEAEAEAALALAMQRDDAVNFIEVVVGRDDCTVELLEWGSRVSAANGRAPNPQ
mmetsp:Transcript_11341/g.28757  ORF Transcript_11341/g.28757 Transcript_11341/m.28757 type:complete len:359 (+) Transcript_11341:221-1297(+)